MTSKVTEWTPQRSTMDDECTVCPHCGYRHGDAWEGMSETPRTMTCDGCGKTIQYWTEFSATHMASVVKDDPRG